jgi:hypothetical protein
LRLRAPFRLAVSTWSRKSPIRSASRSSILSRVGALPRCSLAKRKSSRKVSRYPAIVFALASIWVQRRSVKKRWSSAGKVEAVIGAPPRPKEH